jgi:hypothetical protein
MLAAHCPPEIIGPEARTREITPRVAPSGFDPEALVTDRSGQPLGCEAQDSYLSRRSAAYPHRRDLSTGLLIAALPSRSHRGQGIHTTQSAARMEVAYQRPLVPDREPPPNRETATAGILDIYESVLTP